MRHAVGIDSSFLKTGSEMESVVGIYLMSMLRGLGRFSLRTLQTIGFTVLATFGAWPAVAYLVYMAVDS